MTEPEQPHRRTRTHALTGEEHTAVLRDLTRLSELRRDPIGQACARIGGPLDLTLWSNYASGFDYPNLCRSLTRCC